MERAVLICLSGGLEAQDKIPLRVKARLDTAYDLFMDGNFAAIITTSKGTYRDPNPHATTEAEAARSYLTGRGISEKQILTEERSLDTVGNAFFLRASLLDHRGFYEPTVVTSEFHMPLARFVFEKVLGDRYKSQFVEAPNTGMTEEELTKWRRHEEEMLNFYQKLFAGVRKGDLGFFERYIYDSDPAYTGKVDEAHQQLSEKIKAIWETDS